MTQTPQSATEERPSAQADATPNITGNAAQLVLLRQPHSRVAEAYRRLRTSLLLSKGGDLLHTLLVTGTVDDEGQSTTIANLAVAIAQADYKVLLIDCNFHRPHIHDLFNLPNEQGLTSLLDEEPLKPFPVVDLPNLHVLPSGQLRSDMSDAIVSQRMETVLEDLGEGMDIVLLDAPPINLVSDAAVLARRADGALLVCRAGMTRRHDVREARHMLERVDAQILGVVLTDVEG